MELMKILTEELDRRRGATPPVSAPQSPQPIPVGGSPPPPPPLVMEPPVVPPPTAPPARPAAPAPTPYDFKKHERLKDDIVDKIQVMDNIVNQAKAAMTKQSYETEQKKWAKKNDELRRMVDQRTELENTYGFAAPTYKAPEAFPIFAAPPVVLTKKQSDKLEAFKKKVEDILSKLNTTSDNLRKQIPKQVTQDEYDIIEKNTTNWVRDLRDAIKDYDEYAHSKGAPTISWEYINKIHKFPTFAQTQVAQPGAAPVAPQGAKYYTVNSDGSIQLSAGRLKQIHDADAARLQAMDDQTSQERRQITAVVNKGKANFVGQINPATNLALTDRDWDNLNEDLMIIQEQLRQIGIEKQRRTRGSVPGRRRAAGNVLTASQDIVQKVLRRVGFETRQISKRYGFRNRSILEDQPDPSGQYTAKASNATGSCGTIPSAAWSSWSAT